MEVFSKIASQAPSSQSNLFLKPWGADKQGTGIYISSLET
ncbi:hypothetical protein P5673_028144 [Acropora cervicornis]|uniref:Uncharacterized protein n=1 Tax=Acropora cervicornis TaxID=6130 RepID=A0AAD9PYM2_ACRCE|nr:hypothetical protein P5673_028144 [Acropora cervicornis]